MTLGLKLLSVDHMKSEPHKLICRIALYNFLTEQTKKMLTLVLDKATKRIFSDVFLAQICEVNQVLSRMSLGIFL